MKREKSCGTVLFTVIDGVVNYVLIQNTNNGHCGFPKGHVEGCETEKETALRETWEETSVRAEICGDFRYKISYRMKNGVHKTVIYFIARFSNQIPCHNSCFEFYNLLMLPYDEAYKKLTFPSAKLLLKEANDNINNILFNNEA